MLKSKTSGIGRETHKMMLAAYTQVKNIYISTREEREGFYWLPAEYRLLI